MTTVGNYLLGKQSISYSELDEFLSSFGDLAYAKLVAKRFLSSKLFVKVGKQYICVKTISKMNFIA